MKALVTGAAGFIGSHLVDGLLEEGYEVVGIDNLSVGSLENISHLKENKRFKFVKGDIRDEKFVKKMVKGVDIVFHFAASANMKLSVIDHKVDLENNIIGTNNVLDAMARHNVKDFVFASTSALYGEATIVPTPEDYPPRQTSLYGASKLAGEAYAEAYGEFAGIRSWSFRFGTVIGERCTKGVIWDFVNKLKKNPRQLEILGDGKQRKDYIYIKDCIDGILLGYHKAKQNVNILNLAVEYSTTPNEIARMVIDKMGLKNVKISYTGGERGFIGDNKVVYLKTNRIKALGWRPKYNAKQAIEKTIEWSIANCD